MNNEDLSVVPAPDSRERVQLRWSPTPPRSETLAVAGKNLYV